MWNYPFQDCSPGTYNPTAGSVGCLVCPEGSSCGAKAINPTDCISGQYALNGSSECTDCPPGFKCPSTMSAPVYCEEGTFQSASGQTTCSECPAGSGCPHRNESVTCEAGTYSALGDAFCQACTDGNYSTAGKWYKLYISSGFILNQWYSWIFNEKEYDQVMDL